MLVKVYRATWKGVTKRLILEVQVDSRESLARVRDTYIRGGGGSYLADAINAIRRRLAVIKEMPETMEFGLMGYLPRETIRKAPYRFTTTELETLKPFKD